MSPQSQRLNSQSVAFTRMNTMRLVTTLIFCALSAGLATQAVAKPEASSKTSTQPNQVSDLQIETHNGETVLRIKGDQTPAFSVFKLGNPLRLFVDISNSKLSNNAIQKQVENGLVTQVGLLQFENDTQAITRAIIGFNQDAVTQYDVTTEGNDVVIKIQGKTDAAATAVANATKDVSRLQKQLDQEIEQRRQERDQLASLKKLSKAQQEKLNRLEKELGSQASAPKDARTIEPLNAVRGLDIVSVNGRSQIIIDLDRPGAFKTTTNENGRSVMILNNVELPAALRKKLAGDTKGGTVRFVEAKGDASQTRLEANLAAPSTEVVRQSGKRLIWEFTPTSLAQVEQRPLPRFKGQTPPDRTTYTSAPPRKGQVVTNPTEVTRIPGLKRKRITIDLRNADIQNVLRLISQEGGINIVTSGKVTGNITMKLANVPLDEVFLTILQAQGLGYEKRGSVFRVAPQSQLLNEQRARAEAAKVEDDVRPLELFMLPVRYANAKDMEKQISGLISKRGSLSVDKRTNTLVIKDVPDNLNAIKQLVDSLDSQVPQVLIEARIVETQDSFAREFGIQWGGDVSFSQANGNPTGLSFPSVLGLSGGAAGSAPQGVSSTPNFAVNLPAAAGAGAGGALGLTMGSIGGALNLNLRLSALEETGHAKIVSAPQIMTLDNQSASISQGRSIPVSVVSSNGVNTSMVNATLSLDVTPSVTPDGNIRLKIEATKNEPDFQNTGASGDPSIVTRSASTELMIRDGDTTVIGGIYTSNTGSSNNGVPFLKDIPILGYFFRTTSTSNRRSELLIFITPRIVNRADSIGGGAPAKTDVQAL